MRRRRRHVGPPSPRNGSPDAAGSSPRRSRPRSGFEARRRRRRSGSGPPRRTTSGDPGEARAPLRARCMAAGTPRTSTRPIRRPGSPRRPRSNDVVGTNANRRTSPPDSDQLVRDELDEVRPPTGPLHRPRDVAASVGSPTRGGFRAPTRSRNPWNREAFRGVGTFNSVVFFRHRTQGAMLRSSGPACETEECSSRPKSMVDEIIDSPTGDEA